jgi:SAM-dependent methyltransferase
MSNEPDQATAPGNAGVEDARTVDVVREEVRARYAAAARAVQQVTGGEGCCQSSATCCSPSADEVLATQLPDPENFGANQYPDADRDHLPVAAVTASLGCGNPLLVAELKEGETVLDLGSGGGIDVLLSAKRVGPTGKAYGLDMTDEMLALARDNAAKAGASNVEFLKGHIERIPLPDASVDVVISNCVINLSADKSAVFSEIARVLRPGGRLGVADVVAEDRVTPEERAASGDWASCAAGALSRSEYLSALAAAGLDHTEVRFINVIDSGMNTAFVRAMKPTS